MRGAFFVPRGPSAAPATPSRRGAPRPHPIVTGRDGPGGQDTSRGPAGTLTRGATLKPGFTMYRIALAALAAVIIIVSPAAAPRAQDNSLTRSDVENDHPRVFSSPIPSSSRRSSPSSRRSGRWRADAARLDQLERHREALRTRPSTRSSGKPEGDVTLVEFFDYNCVSCRRALEDIECSWRRILTSHRPQGVPRPRQPVHGARRQSPSRSTTSPPTVSRVPRGSS